MSALCQILVFPCVMCWAVDQSHRAELCAVEWQLLPLLLTLLA